MAEEKWVEPLNPVRQSPPASGESMAVDSVCPELVSGKTSLYQENIKASIWVTQSKIAPR